MTKEEFMAMSLPFGLKYKEPEYKVYGHVIYEEKYVILNNYNFYSVLKNNKQLVLRPLSDLTKEIEHKGENFVPIERIIESFIEGTEDALDQSLEVIEYFIENENFSRIEYLPFILIQKLIEWHFAVGLEERDYIDINTLNENPYK